MNFKSVIFAFLTLSIPLSSCAVRHTVDVAKSADEVAKSVDDAGGHLGKGLNGLDEPLETLSLPSTITKTDDLSRASEEIIVSDRVQKEVREAAENAEEIVSGSDGQWKTLSPSITTTTADDLSKAGSQTLNELEEAINNDLKTFKKKLKAISIKDKDGTNNISEEIAKGIICEHLLIILKGDTDQEFDNLKSYLDFLETTLKSKYASVFRSEISAIMSDDFQALYKLAEQVHNKIKLLETAKEKKNNIAKGSDTVWDIYEEIRYSDQC